MSFGRLAVAALCVAVWFAGWALAVGRISADPRPVRVWGELVEAALLTAFATLWFASLGHGEWWLVFGVLALLVEGPIRSRHRVGLAPEPASWRPVALGLLRFLAAGLILNILL